MSIYTLDRISKALNSQLDIPCIHYNILKRYAGIDWLERIRFEQHLICSLPICSHRNDKRILFLVGLAPNVIYPLRQIETVRILDGEIRTFAPNREAVWSSKNNHKNTFLVDKESYLWSEKNPTAMLCMMNTTK
jgi:hypothetical protein